MINPAASDYLKIERIVFICLILTGVMGSYWNPRDLAGWFILVMSFLFVLVMPQIRSNVSLRYAVWFVLFCHHLMALIFALGPDDLFKDAQSFHRHATQYAASGDIVYAIDFEFYSQALGFFYRLGGFYQLGGESRLLGAEISVGFFVIALLLFIKLLEQLEVESHQPLLILLFGCLPSVVFFTSITIRESWELALFLAYSVLLFRFLDRPAIPVLLYIFLAILVFGFLHKGLILFALFLSIVVLAISWWLTLTGKAALSVSVCAVLVPLGLALIVLIVSKYDFRNSAIVNALLAGRVLENIEGSRGLIARDEPRSAFDVDLDFGSFFHFTITYVQVYWRYLFGPFIWGVENIKDAVASSEALLRLILFSGMIVSLFRTPLKVKTLILVTLYITMTMLWALGTTNYGQAIRHHVLTNWILIAMGAPFLFSCLHAYSRRTLSS